MATRKRIPLTNNATPANGQLPIGNGTDYTVANLNAGGGISISNAAGAITISNIGLTNINVSAGAASNNLSNIVFSNSNNVSFALNGSTITATVASSLTNINFSAGAASNNLSVIVFSNSNNVSFGLNGSTVTGTASFNQTAQTQSNIQALYDGANSISTGTVRFSNSNGISFGINGQTVTGSHNGITAGIQSISAGTQTVTSGQIVFSNSNGISFGINAQTMTASYVSAPILSLYENQPMFIGASFIKPSISSQYVFPFTIDQGVSFSYLRFIMSNSFITTTLATAVGAYGSSQGESNTMNIVIFTKMTGANSLSYATLSSTSVTWAVGFSYSGTSSTHSQSQSFSWYNSAGAQNTTVGNTVGTGSNNVQAGFVGTVNFSGLRFQEVPWASSISPGIYYMGLQIMTTTGGGITNFTNFAWNQSIGCNTNMNSLIANYNAASNSSMVLIQGLGSVGTNSSNNATYSFPDSAFSTVANNPKPYFQMIRNA
jgi:hypothetical protein